jgi:hypothetical protein
VHALAVDTRLQLLRGQRLGDTNSQAQASNSRRRSESEVAVHRMVGARRIMVNAGITHWVLRQ